MKRMNENSLKNLIPAKAGEVRNPFGKNNKIKTRITEALREILESKEMEVSTVITDATGNKKKQHFILESGNERNLGWVIAARLIQKSISGDERAINIVLDRVEGKAKQEIELSGSLNNDLTEEQKKAIIGAYNKSQQK